MAGPEPTSGTPTAHKTARRRLTYRQELATIRSLPQLQRLIVVMKVAGVFLVAIGIEGIVTHTYILALIFIPLGVFVSMVPLRVRLDVCLACSTQLDRGTAICPKCGAPQM